MKRLTFILAASFAALAALSAENIPFASLAPKTAKSMGMGGVFSSVPTAEFSFFGNPAAFATKQSNLIVPTVDAWLYLRPTIANIQTLTKNAGTMSTFLPAVFGLVAQNGGTGAGASVGFGYAGKGLGLGLFALTDEYIEGSNPAGAILHSDMQLTGVIGLGFPFDLGFGRLSLGGDLRPFYRLSVPGTEAASVLVKIKNNESIADVLMAKAFFGAAMDLGATLQMGSLTIGLTLRDLAPSYPVASGTLSALGKQLGSGSMPSTSGSTDTAVFTPDLSAGLSWAPRLLPGLVDPTLYFELQDPVAVIKSADGWGSALNLLHAGAEVRLLSFLTLRGGINRGWLSAGAGLKLLFLDLNAAVFTEELGPLPGDAPRSGLSVQAAIRL
jgi:hypothetical protein